MTKEDRDALQVIQGALNNALVGLGFLTGKLKVQFGRKVRARSWKRRHGRFGNTFVVPFDWIETVLEQGLVCIGPCLVLQTRPIEPLSPAEAAWDVLYVQVGAKLSNPMYSQVVRYGGITRLALYQEEALETCIREYKYLLGLEPTPLPF